MAGAIVSPAPPPAGTPRWYAWLFSPRERRDTLAVLFQLESELRGIVSAPKDHGVAHVKLQWWHEELERLSAGEPRHPLTLALARLCPGGPGIWMPLRAFLTSLQLELAAVAIDDDAELERFLMLADGLARTMALALGGGPDAAREALGARVGQAIRGAQIAADWTAAPIDDARREALHRLTIRTRDTWENAMKSFAESGGDLRGLRVLGELHMQQLARLERASFQAGASRELPALRSLWTAWRAARQHGPA